MTNILITGINGFIGAWLARHLAEDSNNQIYGLARSEKVESTINALQLYKKKNISIIHGDIYIYTTLEELLIQYNIDQIYHLAAKVIVRDAVKSPLTTYMINMNGTLNVLEAIRLIKVQYQKEIATLVMSSDKAYGISQDLPYKETHPLNGNDVYSSSKAIQDILSRAYANNFELPVVVSRACNTYGPYDFNWSRIIPSLAKSCFDKNEIDNPLILNKDSYQNLREYMYVDDTVNGLVSLINNIEITRCKAFNISSGNKLTTEQVVQKFFEISNITKKMEFKEKDQIFKEIPEQYLDTAKIYEATRWKANTSFELGLEKTIEGYKEWYKLLDTS